MGTSGHKREELIIQKKEINFEEIPDDQFICPECDSVPELLNLHTDNGHIVLKCKIHGKFDLKIEDYYKRIKNSNFNYFKTKCNECRRIQENKDNMFYYCYDCKNDYCEYCHKNTHHNMIKVNEKNNKCLNHFEEEVTQFCFDCEENICSRERETNHKDHKIISIYQLNKKITNYRYIIYEKNKNLSNIIKFNNLILNTFEKFQNNYYHIKNIINLGKSIEKENTRDSDDIENVFYDLSNEIQKSLNANECFKQKKFYLTRKEEYLHLNNRKLGDIEFKLISSIKFNKLQEIQLSGNEIKNIESFRNLKLPFLEYLDMSYNKIENIEPIAELNSKKIKEICLQNNEIKDFYPFLKSDFPNLELLRVENNIFDESSKFNMLKEKFRNKIIYEPMTFQNFKGKYNGYITENSETINYVDIKEGEKLLKDLYLIIPYNNRIKKFFLRNNNIKDISILTRIPFFELEELDLSMNNITNLKFLEKMELRNLTHLYLNDNKINNIHPLIKLELKSLKVLTLQNNNFNINDKKIKSIIDNLDKRGILIKIGNY